MIADRLHHQEPAAVYRVDQVQDRPVVGVEPDVEIAVRFTLHEDDAALDRRALRQDAQPVWPVDVRPQSGIAAIDRQRRRRSRVARLHDEECDGERRKRQQRSISCQGFQVRTVQMSVRA